MRICGLGWSLSEVKKVKSWTHGWRWYTGGVQVKLVIDITDFKSPSRQHTSIIRRFWPRQDECEFLCTQELKHLSRYFQFHQPPATIMAFQLPSPARNLVLFSIPFCNIYPLFP
ncbi:hypothetical protein ACMFMG_010867 [Clarireedia jacksonii]